MAMNGYFKQDDPQVAKLAGFRLHEQWWTRGYEYPWALQYAEAGTTVADMGCGYHYRPFKDALAEKVQFVLAVDANMALMTQPKPDNMEFIVADISQRVENIPSRHLDTVFSNSVLENRNMMYWGVLREFHRVLKDAGRAVLTFDVPFDDDAPMSMYPGLPLDRFERALKEFGFRYAGKVKRSKKGNVVHQDWNLCCFHCVLEKI